MRASVLAAAFLLAALPAAAQKGVPTSNVVVGGVAMASDRDIMDNLPLSAEHSTFTSLLRSSGLADTLRGRGPFTVFAPTNAAFAALPADSIEAAGRPDARTKLVALLSAQIVPGNYSVARFQFLLRAGKGRTELETLSGGKLFVSLNGPNNLVVTDPKGSVARIVVYEAKQSNGVIYVTDRVLSPG